MLSPLAFPNLACFWDKHYSSLKVHTQLYSGVTPSSMLIPGKLQEPNVMLGIKPEFIACKSNTLPTMLLLLPQGTRVIWKFYYCFSLVGESTHLCSRIFPKGGLGLKWMREIEFGSAEFKSNVLPIELFLCPWQLSNLTIIKKIIRKIIKKKK